jgi:hypothetical protein
MLNDLETLGAEECRSLIPLGPSLLIAAFG